MAALAAPPSAKALELDGSQWEGRSGLRARLTREGSDRYVLRAEPAGLFGDAFSAVSTGTLLLRMQLSGSTFSGTAYSFGRADPGCTVPYSVNGNVGEAGLRWSGYEPKSDHWLSCHVSRSVWSTTTLRLIATPSPSPPTPKRLVPIPSPPPPTPPVADAGSDIGSTLTNMAIVLVGASLVVIVARFAYLRRLRSNRLLPRKLPRAPREPSSALSSSLPSSSGKILGSRTALVEADAKFVAQHVNWLLQRTAQTNAAADLVDARLRFAEKLAALATVPALMNTSDPNATPASFSLTLAEIEQMIVGMPEISPQVRDALLLLLQARLREKLG